MQPSKTQEIISQFFALYLQSTSNFEHFEKKHDPHRFCIPDIMDCERRS